MLTWLTAQGLPDSQIQLISGHASKKSLEIYQHLSLPGRAAGLSEGCEAAGILIRLSASYRERAARGGI
jgi:hypothetical protein